MRKKRELQLDATKGCPYGEGKVNGDLCGGATMEMNHHLGLGFN